MSILIVDDDVEYLHYISAVLGMDGHRPVLAYSGEAARKEIEGQKFSLILMDLVLPDMPGLELIESARNADALTVCVTMTAFATIASAMDAMRRGAYDYLLKPTGMDVIKAAVRRGLEYHKIRTMLVERTIQIETFKRESRQAAEFVDHISMDLRNQLSVVYGFSTLLAESGAEMFDSQEKSRAIDLIRKGAERMRETLNDFTAAKPPQLSSDHSRL